ncbi:uncharacterized protein [Lolium perenne]|uniref:uncharacterized protein n=1 Tax=Lolium perenne TaxID=4522 RepID=UPI003A99B7CD
MPLPSSCQTRCERLRAESLRQVTIVGPTYSKRVRLCCFCLVDYADSSLHQRVFLFLQSPLAASTHSRESATLPFPSPSWSTLAPTANSPPSISPFSVALGVLGTVGFAAPVVAACWAGEPSAWLEDKHGEANHDVFSFPFQEDKVDFGTCICRLSTDVEEASVISPSACSFEAGVLGFSHMQFNGVVFTIRDADNVQSGRGRAWGTSIDLQGLG